MPERIQLSRAKGWRLPDGAVSVARPTRWGNFYVVRRALIAGAERGRWEERGPWTVAYLSRRMSRAGNRLASIEHQFGGFGEDRDAAIRFAVDLFERALVASWEMVDGDIYRRHYLGPLIGRDLACWCPTGSGVPCHADVLLRYANDGGSWADA
jgi:hypothetical protein